MTSVQGISDQGTVVASTNWGTKSPLSNLAIRLAESLTPLHQPARKFSLKHEIEIYARTIRQSYEYFEVLTRTPHAGISAAGEWLLDNYYIVRQALRQIQVGLPADYYRRLPRVELQDGGSRARIYLLARAFVHAGEARTSIEAITEFIQTFQTITALETGEVWAFANMLRLCILEMLAEALSNLRESPFQIDNLEALKTFDRTVSGWIALQSEPGGDSTVASCIASLRFLDSQDWKEFFESTSLVEQVLNADPAGVFSKMDFETRNRYRNVVEEIANHSPLTEIEIARLAVENAGQGGEPREKHIGFYLIGSGRSILESQCHYRAPFSRRVKQQVKQHALPVYLGGIAVLTAVICAAGVTYAMSAGAHAGLAALVFFLVLLPASETAVYLLNWLVTRWVPPHVLPKLELREGIPPDMRTVVVVPAILKSENELGGLASQLENHFIGNADPQVHFALLADLADAPSQVMEDDKSLVDRAIAVIDRLNAQHGNDTYQPFLLLHRDREWNAAENCWMGWERKRGKLEAFNKLLTGDDTSGFSICHGPLNALRGTRYVITVDADTILPRGTARRLIGTIAHPLNQAVFDPETSKVIAGYTVLQPRIQVRPAISNLSVFTRVFSGDTDLDLYSRAVSDVYQDLFGEGNYVGKGIYDVYAFNRSLDGRVPDNAILSHDLFEGLHGRCGLVTEITLFEDYPLHYLAFALRLHRWVRGDWQLLPWLFPRIPIRGDHGTIKNELSLLSRWKIVDNLRRSLLDPAALIFLVAVWFLLPGSAAVWSALAFFSYLLQLVLNLINHLKPGRTSNDVTSARSFRHTALRLLFKIVFLPYEFLLITDAILTTLVRLFVTHRKLLQWTTAAHSLSVFGRTLNLKVVWREMIIAPLIAGVLGVGLLAWKISGLPGALPFLGLWFATPYVAVRISQISRRSEEGLSDSENQNLRKLARLTWLFFEHFVGPEDHWLPPDHFQEDPRGIIAHRTSPTNIGLQLVAELSAFDLGYIGAQELALRLRNTFNTLSLLERDRGHFLNWYDTHTLAPLPPRYISTVDSGNLAACFIVLRQGLADVASRTVINWDGLVDTLDMLIATIDESHIGRHDDELHATLSDLHTIAADLSKVHHYSAHMLVTMFTENQSRLETLLIELIERSSKLDQGILNQLSTWVERTRNHVEGIERDLMLFTPWSLSMSHPPELFERPTLPPVLALAWRDLQVLLSVNPGLEDIPRICMEVVEILDRIEMGLQLREGSEQALEWCRTFRAELGDTSEVVQNLLDELRALEDTAEGFLREMDFRFLFDPMHKVFHIGYNLQSGKLDANYYDLLASEARIASLVAIGKGDVPLSHWLHMARPLTDLGDGQVLLSWSGTMFEYLMPTLFMRSYPNTLLTQSCQAAVDYQIAYAGRRRIPWGISESSFYYMDAHQVYQYKAFGVPGLGYKRGLDEDFVVAPYASILALPFAPKKLLRNIERFRSMHMCGTYGLFEAVDFTPGRLRAGQEYAIVRSYMAHHQGMSLISLSNYLLGNKMVRRFHRDARIRNVELLLQESTPNRVEIEMPTRPGSGTLDQEHVPMSLQPWSVSENAPYPQIHSLSNGSYSLLITATGSGFSKRQSLDLTRWRADTTLDHWGSWLYIHDMDSGHTWSATSQPVNVQPDNQRVEFYPHRAEFGRRDGDISIHTQVAVAADDDVEIRWVSLTNHGSHPRHLALTNYLEVILSAQDTDRRHPAFNKLFVESEFIEGDQFLLFHRRARSSKDKPVYLAQFITAKDNDIQLAGYECDRAHFIGLGGNLHGPAAILRGGGLSGTTGATLDPISAMQARVTLAPHETVELAYLTAAAASRTQVNALVRRYRQWSNIPHAINTAGIEAEKEMRLIGMTTGRLERAQKMLSALLYPTPAMRADPATLAANTLGQPGLWPFSISGDHPILLIRTSSADGLPLLGDVLQAHTYWRRRGLLIDLVILNTQESSYDESLPGQVARLLKQTESELWLNKRGGIFVLREDHLEPAELILLSSAARVVLDDTSGTLDDQLRKLDQQPVRLPHFIPLQKSDLPEDAADGIMRPRGLRFDNGWGGFSPDGREYVIYLEPGRWPPAPWINVIANDRFGFLASSSGLGCTWAVNSGENRLTPWHNDPVSEPPSEAVYLRDEDTGQVWSPTPLPARDSAPYLVRHGAGYTVYEHNSHGIEQEMSLFAVPGQPVKVVQLRLKNKTSRTRRINVTYYAEWVLGNTRDMTAQYIIPEFDSRCFALLARNPYNVEFATATAFLAASRELNWVTTDRTEFLGLLGNYARPAALERVGLSARVQAGADPCAAMQLMLWLAEDEEKEVTFLLGQGQDHAHARELITRFQDIHQVRSAWQAVTHFWDDVLGTVTVETPNPAMDIMLNRWLLYQSLSCRIWGRTALYQSSGAFGFRDQLQDVLSVLHSRPEICREHILSAAHRQFEQGDVLHWWHPPSGRGIRTRISDNLLWLPFVTAAYVNHTGDASILSEQVPYLSAAPLKEDEDERYGQYEAGEQTGTLYDHCLRAIQKGVTAGKHGLPLMGAGDWNDGMNRVGAHGQGESVWLGWFSCSVLNDFSGMCTRMGDATLAAEFKSRAKLLAESIEAHAWDGDWYRRGYFDDGTALGSVARQECQIDSISQSWAVLSRMGDPARARAAMQSLEEHLIRLEDGLLLLLDPPFDLTLRDPGYIKGYPPGVRENGGQYTHAALWAVWAFAELGDGNVAMRLFDMLNPINHCSSTDAGKTYKLEPYVVAADVYSVPPHVGRGGWSWYTGSAGWMYRLGIERILGLRREADVLWLDPCIDPAWDEYTLRYRQQGTEYVIQVSNPGHVSRGVRQVLLDGQMLPDGRIPLAQDGKTHIVIVTLGQEHG